MKNQEALESVSQCMGVSSELLEKALCQRVIAARGEVMQKGHTVSEAIYGRDAFAKVTNGFEFIKHLVFILVYLFVKLIF